MSRVVRRVTTFLWALLYGTGSALAELESASPPAQLESVPQPSEASGATRVVLLAKDGEEPLVARVGAELRSLRFEVVTAEAQSSTPSGPELEAVARRFGARAAVQVVSSGDSIDLWLVNSETHEVVYRRIVSDRDRAVSAFRSLEILRGSLIDLQALAPTPVQPVSQTWNPTPKPELPPPTSEKKRPFLLALGVAAGLASGQPGPSWYGLASLRVTLSSRLALNGFVLAPLSTSQIDGEGGFARLKSGLIGGGLSFRPWQERVLTPAFLVGMAAVVLHTRGVPAAGFSGSTQLAFAAYPHAGFELALAIGPIFRLQAELLGGAVVPRPVVLFADRRVAAWGSALFVGGLGAAIVFQ